MPSEDNSSNFLEFLTHAFESPIPENHYRRVGFIYAGNKRWIMVKTLMNAEAMLNSMKAGLLSITWKDTQYVEKKQTLSQRMERVEKLIEKVLEVLQDEIIE